MRSTENRTERQFRRRERVSPRKKENIPTASAPGYESLRKELADVTTARAEMELEYMNLLSSIENEKRTTEELLQARTRERDSLKDTVSHFQAEVKELRSRIDNEKSEHTAEIDQLLAALDEKSCGANTVPSMVRTASGQNERALRKEMEELRSSFEAETGRLRTELDEKNNLISKKDDELEISMSTLENAAQKIDALGTVAKENEGLRKELKELRCSSDRMKIAHVSELERLQTFLDEKHSLIRKKDEEFSAVRLALRAAEQQNEACGATTQQKGDLHKELGELRSRLNREKSMHRAEISRLQAGLDEKDEFLKEKNEEFEATQLALRTVSQRNESFAGVTEQNEVLLKEVEELKKQLIDQSKQSREETEALTKHQEQAKKKALDEMDRSDRLQAAVAKLQTRIVVKDKEIEALKCTVSKSIEHNDALKAEAEAMRQQLENESSRADALELEIDAIRMARGFSRHNSPSFESTLARERRLATDREEIDRLTAVVAKKDSLIEEKDAELQTVQQSLRRSIEQSSILIDEVAHLKEELKRECNPQDNISLERDEECNKENEAEIDILRKELAKVRVENEALRKELEHQKNMVHRYKVSMQSDFEERLGRERQDIQEALDAKEEEAVQMRKDFNELCESMKGLASARREEKNELQAEIARYSREAAERVEEIHSLKKTLEEVDLKHKNEVKRYNSKLREMKSQAMSGMHSKKYEKKIEDLGRTNETLRRQVVALADEAHKLRARVDSLVNASDSSQAVKVLRSRNEALKREVEKLRKKYDGLERSITRVSI